MITPTHIVLNVGLAKWFRARPIFADRSTRRLFILGGLAPDVGLFAAATGATAYLVISRGWSVRESFQVIFDDYFYAEPVFVIAHNLLHAPLVIVGLYAVALVAAGRGRPRLGNGLKAFALGCAVHTAVDIPVHHNDGPLLLFPFEWSLRFNSPVSYYDPDHFGSVLAPIDAAITVVGGLLIVVVWAMRRRRDTSSGRPTVRQ
ncbi:hypothetical protein C6I20_07590 [Aeromicrobium sp. A1-2]|uniref:hypothetical protein n=1 Tax=Aeromicrobium sp. A1-2 TaxID=2107713 RepID=UPI000E54DEF1|nr:hypothetical protein [Aeromicrobium sp. A1-2]AXT85061.1 hypothetical protein C6I20_07590 [Aeromicrobium sp. A1-2]